MQEHANILIADDDAALAHSIDKMLRAEGHACTVAAGDDEAVELARSGDFDVVITSLPAGQATGAAILRTGREARADCQVICLANERSPAQAVAAMIEGAMTYLEKPVNMAELAAVVQKACDYISLSRDRRALQEQVASRFGLENIIGNSRPMLRVFKRVKQAAATDATVLIQGETGTGKDLVASAIHFNGRRAPNRFVPLNCAGMVETILESELFGHEKGAFTSAISSRVGVFEYANHGTLFLDEIGDMPASSQVKLLRVLEHGEIVRVGSNEPIRVDVRVVAATHQNLPEKTKAGSFRQDLFYRLNVVGLQLPPLRERQGDMALLVEYFLADLTRIHGKTVHSVTPGVRKLFFRHQWPGNVRELRNCLEHMVVVSTDDELGEDDLPEYLTAELEADNRQLAAASMVGQPLEEVEKHLIARTLEVVEGNREKAAEMLGIGERTLYRKIQKYGLR